VRRLSPLLVVGLCLALVVGPTAAASATVAIDAPSTVESGETVTVSLTLTNTGDSEDSYLVNVSAPDSWSVVDHSDDDGEFDSDDSKWLYTSVDAGSSVQPSVTFETAGDTGTAEITATAENSSGLRDSATHSITVESESDDGGGSDDDDSSSDDESSSSDDDDSGSDDDSSSSGDDGDDSSSSDSDTSSDDTYGSDASDTPSDGYGSSSDDAEYTASGSDTDDTGSSTPSYDGDDSVETVDTPDEGASSDSGNDGGQSETDSRPVQSGLGIGLLGMAVLAVAGLAVLLVQRK
jgi:hypothetical protein